jgi:hypothetical protein
MVKKEQLMFYYMACRHATSSIQNTYTDHRNMLLLIRPDRKHRDLNTGFPVHRSTVLVLARFGNLEPPERAARLQGLSSAGDANCPRHGDPVLVQGRAVEERASCHPPGPPLAGHGLPALGGGGARRRRVGVALAALPHEAQQLLEPLGEVPVRVEHRRGPLRAAPPLPRPRLRLRRRRRRRVERQLRHGSDVMTRRVGVGAASL